MKLHEVLFAPCLSARPLLSCHRSIARASARVSARASARVSARASVTGLLLVCHWSVAGLSLVCCWSVTGLLGSWPLVMVADRASLVHRSCVTRLPVPLSAGLLLVRRWPWPLLCLLLSRCSACLSVCWPVAFLSLVCLLARRCSSVADVSLVCLLVHHWLSLSCTCSGSPVHRSSICSCIARASVTRASVTGLLVRLSLVRLSLVCHSSVCHSSVCSCIARPSARASLVRLSLVCHSSVTRLSLVRLLVRLSLVRLLVRLSLVRPLESGLLVAGPSLLSLTSLSVRSSLVCFLVHLLGSWSLPRGLPLVFHRSVVGHGRSCICSFVARCSARCFPVCCSVTSLSAVLSPVCLLFCHQSVCSGHGRWFVVRPSAARRCSVYWSRGNWPVPGLSARSSLVRLIGSWSLACSSVAGLLFVRHWPWSSICYSCTACLSPRLSCRSFACCSAIGPPLLCLLVRLLVWLSHGLECRWFIAGPSARASLVYLLLCR